MEVGKKYRYLDNAIVECTYVAKDGNLAVLKNTMLEFPVYKTDWKDYREYKEPRKIKKRVIVYENRVGETCTYTAPLGSFVLMEAQTKGTYAGLKVLDIVDFEWTEKV